MASFETCKEGDLVDIHHVVYEITTIVFVQSTITYKVFMTRKYDYDTHGYRVNEEEFPKEIAGRYATFGTFKESIAGYKTALSITSFEISKADLEMARTGIGKDDEVDIKKSTIGPVDLTKTVSKIDKKKYPNWWLIAG